MGCGSWVGGVRGQGETPGAAPAPGSDRQPAGGAARQPQQDLDRTVRELRDLSQAQTKAQERGAPGSEIERLRTQVELQQKQIDVLLRMTQLLADQVKKPPAVAALHEQVATQEARSQQAARRDQELARSRDDLLERMDAQTRAGPMLPATLRELFLPTRTNESPLTLYGSTALAFNSFDGLKTTFRDQSFELRPYLLLNEKFLMSANVALQQGTVQLWRAQTEWFMTDSLTFVAGRFYSPLGFYSERLRLNWIIKTPDPPLMFNQVYPAQLSFDGLQVRGARYLFDWPVKLEYSGFVANGLNVPGAKLSPAIYSNLNNFATNAGSDVTSAKAWGGRIGFSIPQVGFIAGLSGLSNQSYTQDGQFLTLWDVDASWHKGNWDARFELAKMWQDTPAPAPSIYRFGFYAQVAYRQYNNPNPVLQKLEGVFRFDHVQFDGINLAQTGLNFGGLGLTYANQPLDRDRFTFGLNYWFYPSLVFKAALEWNHERGVPSLRDNGFIGQVVWGF